MNKHKVLTYFLLILILFSFNFCSKKVDKKVNKKISIDDILTEDYASTKKTNVQNRFKTLILTKKALKLHKTKQYKNAVKLWKKAFSLYATGEMYYELGNALFNLKKLEKAVKAYELAVYLNYSKPYLAYYNSACAYSKLKDAESGKRFLLKAIDAGYTSLYYLRKDPDLAYLRTKLDMEKIIRTIGYMTIRMSLKYAKEKAKNEAGMEKAKKILEEAKELAEQGKYRFAFAKYMEILKFYANQNIYFETGKTLLKLKNYKFAEKAFIAAAALEGGKTGEAYYMAAISNSKHIGLSYSTDYNKKYYIKYKYLELAVKNGYNDYERMRRDKRLEDLCISMIWGYEHIIPIKRLSKNVIRCCFNNKPITKEELIGKWKYSLTIPPAAWCASSYCVFKRDGSVSTVSDHSDSPYQQPPYGFKIIKRIVNGTYILKDNVIYIKNIKTIWYEKYIKGKKKGKEKRTEKIINENETIIIHAWRKGMLYFGSGMLIRD